jgi:ribose transport system substrate-binding protein
MDVERVPPLASTDASRTRILLALVAVLCLAVAGCSTADTGGGPAPAGGGVSATEPDEFVTKRGTPDDFVDMSTVCGTRPIRVAYADGFGGNSWRKIVRTEFEQEAAKCKNITEVKYVDGQGDPQKQIANVKALVAQGFDVIISYPDAGPAMVPAYREAWKAGVAVVPWAVGTDWPGEARQDYLQVVTEDVQAKGKLKGEWMVKTLGGNGNVIFLGGIPGNSTSKAEFAGVKEAFADAPGMKLLEPKEVDTGWDPAQTQKVMAGLLTKHKDIDGIISDYGLGSVGALRAYIEAGRPIPPFATEDGNEFSCMWRKHKGANPNFKMATDSGRTWLVRPALRKAVAFKQGIVNPEPSIVELPLFEDSTSSDPEMQPRCDPSLPPDAILSANLTKEELTKVFS